MPLKFIRNTILFTAFILANHIAVGQNTDAVQNEFSEIKKEESIENKDQLSFILHTSVIFLFYSFSSLIIVLTPDFLKPAGVMLTFHNYSYQSSHFICLYHLYVTKKPFLMDGIVKITLGFPDERVRLFYLYRAEEKYVSVDLCFSR